MTACLRTLFTDIERIVSEIVNDLYLKNEWERTEPDLLAYIPRDFTGPGACNQHFLVVKTPPGSIPGLLDTIHL